MNPVHDPGAAQFIKEATNSAITNQAKPNYPNIATTPVVIAASWGDSLQSPEALSDARAAVEDRQPTPHNAAMTSMTREEMDAKLSASEARMDARMVRIESQLENIAKSQDAVLASNKTTRTTMVVTGISSALAIVLGVGAFNATVLSNMVASFESGKNTSALLHTAEKSLTEAAQALAIATEKTKAAGTQP